MGSSSSKTHHFPCFRQEEHDCPLIYTYVCISKSVLDYGLFQFLFTIYTNLQCIPVIHFAVHVSILALQNTHIYPRLPDCCSYQVSCLPRYTFIFCIMSSFPPFPLLFSHFSCRQPRTCLSGFIFSLLQTPPDTFGCSFSPNLQ